MGNTAAVNIWSAYVHVQKNNPHVLTNSPYLTFEPNFYGVESLLIVFTRGGSRILLRGAHWSER